MLKISLDKLGSLFDAIAEKEALYIPADNAGQPQYLRYQSGMKMTDALNTVRSAKDFFFPQTENLVNFKVSGKTIEIIDPRTEHEDFVVFGVRGCDVRSFSILDKVFLLADPVDTYYENRRKHGTIVSMACSRPSETCFCHSFGIDAAAVSRMLDALERKGFVRIVPRKGAFISDFLHEATPQTLSVIMEYGSSQMDESLLHDLMDMRALIECECARLACLSGRGPADTELPRLMAAIRSSSGTEQIEAICDYHYHLTKLSGNDVYAMTFKAFHGPLRGLTSEHYRSAAERKRSVKLHADLTAAIGAGDAEAASRLVGEIIMRADENLSGKKRRR